MRGVVYHGTMPMISEPTTKLDLNTDAGGHRDHFDPSPLRPFDPLTFCLSDLVTFPLIVVVCLAFHSARADDELVLLSPHWEGIRIEFGDAFRTAYKKETGREVDLKWLDVGGTSEILRFIRSEYKNKPDGINIDLLFGGGTDPFVQLSDLGLLATYVAPDEILQPVASSINGVPLIDPDHQWYAAAMAGFGIIYNKIVLDRLSLPIPGTWEDLVRPELFGWVGSGDPRKSGSVHMMYEIILQSYGWDRGWEIITAMGGNVRGFTASSAQTPKDVAVGEVAYGLAIDLYAWAQVRQAGDDRIGYVMPENLTVVNGDAIAILKGAPNRALAERFIDFVLSEAGQKLWYLRLGEPDGPQTFELGRFCVLPELYEKARGHSSVQVDPFQWKSEFVYDAKLGSGRWGIVNDLVGTLVIDPHCQLAARLKHAYRSRDPDGSLPAVPISEEEVQQIVDEGRWSDARFRNQRIREWSTYIRDAYAAPSERSAMMRNLPALIGLIWFVAMLVYARRQSG